MIQTNELKYNRIVIKAGTGVVTDHGKTLDLSTLKNLVSQISKLKTLGKEIVLVTSGGIAAGKSILQKNDNDNISFKQVLASVGQSYLMRTYINLFEAKNLTVAQALLTRENFSKRLSYLNVRNTLNKLLEIGIIPIINENDVVTIEEIGASFGDNDKLSALVASIVDANLLIILTDTNGLYSNDPKQDSSAQLIKKVDKIDSKIRSYAKNEHDSWSKGGMPSKIDAAYIATKAGIPVVICNGKDSTILEKIVENEEVGTIFKTNTTLLDNKKRWLLGAVSENNQIIVDKGAEIAIQKGVNSLLPSGVVDINGDFKRGESINIVNQDKKIIACGISNYDAESVLELKGIHSSKISEILGFDFGEEIIHRNNMILLKGIN